MFVTFSTFLRITVVDGGRKTEDGRRETKDERRMSSLKVPSPQSHVLSPKSKKQTNNLNINKNEKKNDFGSLAAAGLRNDEGAGE